MGEKYMYIDVDTFQFSTCPDAELQFYGVQQTLDWTRSTQPL